MKTKWSTFLRRFALALFATMSFLFLCVLFAALILVFSESAQTKLVSSSKAFLNDIGIHWQADRSKVYAQTHIGFDQLKIQMDGELPLTGSILIAKLNFDYDLSGIFYGKILVDDITVKDVDAKLALTHKKLPQEEKPEDDGFSDLKSIFDAIPGFIEFKQISLSGINIDLSLPPEAGSGKVQISDLAFESKGFLSSDTTKLIWDLNTDLSLEHQMSSDERRLTAAAKIGLSSEGHLDYASKNRMWSFRFEGKPFDIEASDVSLKSADLLLKQSLFASLDKMRLYSTTAIIRDMSEKNEQSLLFGLEGSRLNVDTNIEFDGIRLKQKAEQSSQIDIALPSLVFKQETKAKLLKAKHIVKSIFGDVRLSIDSKAVSVKSGETKVMIDGLAQKLSGDIQDGEFDLDSAVLIKKIQTPLATDIDRFEFGLKSKGNLSDGKQDLDLNADLRVANDLLFKTKVALNSLSSKSRLTSNSFIKLWRIAQIAKIKELHQAPLGKIEINFEQIAQLANQKPVWDYKFNVWPDFDGSWNNTIDLTQSAPSASLYVQKARLKTQGFFNKDGMKADAGFAFTKLWHPMLERKFDGLANLGFKLSSDLKLIDTTINLSYDKKNLLFVNSKLNERNGSLALNNSVKIHGKQELYGLLKQLTPLRNLGEFQLNIDQTGSLDHKLDSVQDLDADSLFKSALDISTKLTLKQTKVGETPLVVMPKPLEALLLTNLKDDKLAFILDGNSTNVKIPDLASFGAIQLKLKAQIDHLQALKNISIEHDLSVSSPKINPELAKKVDLSTLNLDLSSKASVYMVDLENITIKDFWLKLGDDLISFVGSGDYSVGGDASIKLLAQSDIGKALSKTMPAEGKVNIPIAFRSVQKNVYALELTPEFNSVSAAFGDFAIKSLNGKIKVLESIKINEGGGFSFAYLENFNPFARVDYEGIQQLYKSKPLFWFESLRLNKNLVIGPLTAQPEVRQNLLLLNNVTLNAFDGSVVGRLLVNIDPSEPTIGFLGRFTQLKPSLMADGDNRDSSTDYISGRSALDFDISKRLAKGRFDITTIGKSQLLDLLNIIDPRYEDSQINNARKALALSYPKKVSVEMDQGLMNMKVNVSGVVSKQFRVNSIPLTPLIQAHLAGLLISFEYMFKPKEIGDG